LQNFSLCFLLVVSENKIVLPNGAVRQIARGWKCFALASLRLFLVGLDFFFFQEMARQYIFLIRLYDFGGTHIIIVAVCYSVLQ